MLPLDALNLTVLAVPDRKDAVDSLVKEPVTVSVPAQSALPPSSKSSDAEPVLFRFPPTVMFPVPFFTRTVPALSRVEPRVWFADDSIVMVPSLSTVPCTSRLPDPSNVREAGVPASFTAKMLVMVRSRAFPSVLIEELFFSISDPMDVDVSRIGASFSLTVERSGIITFAPVGGTSSGSQLLAVDHI